MSRRNRCRLVVAALLLGVPLETTASQQPQSSPAAPQQPPPATAAPQPATAAPRQPVAPVTEADRAAAFPPDVHGHAVHDRQWHYFVLFDEIEWQGGASGGLSLDTTSWIGGDTSRLWLRLDGESDDGRLESAQATALWGRSVARWWDVVAGIRQDVDPGPARTWAAIGIQGLAPQWFEVEATGYVGAGGRTQLQLEAEYDLLLTNRLILQPTAEMTVHGKADPERGLGAGLSTLETGVRLRYEIRRELAPYLGVTWERRFFGTADHARSAGEAPGRARLAFGLRTWF